MRLSFRYDPGPPAAVDLSDNTNLWGAAPSAAAALAAAADHLARYPSAYSDALKSAAAAYLGSGLTADHIVTGCGSDNILDGALRALTTPGGRIAFCAPTFVLVPVLARLSHLVPVAVPFTADGQVTPDALLATGAEVIYLCSPNNPTGCGIDRGDIVSIVAGAPGYVIVDEAYAEYAGTSVVDLVQAYPNLLITRTLSKAFGLAALRVGYGAAVPGLVAQIESALGPFRVTAPSAAAGCAALTHDRDWLAAHVAVAGQVRDRFVSDMAGRSGWRVFPSCANFVLVTPTHRDSSRAHVETALARLRAEGIAARPLFDLPGIGDALRITVGPWPLLEQVARLLTTAD